MPQIELLLSESIDAGIYLLTLLAIFVPLERIFAAKEQKIFRSQWLTDLAFYVFQTLIFTKLTILTLQGLEELLQNRFSHFLQEQVSQWPTILQIILVVLSSDFLIYWGHRLAHQNNFLWRFHKIHHTTPRLDWLAAFREHPLDNIYTRVIVNLPALMLGFPLEIIAGFIIFRGLWGNFIHANIDLPLGYFKYLLGSPRLHHWHHDREKNSSCNFANLMPLMDLLFGTYYDPGHMPQNYGITEPLKQRYLNQIIEPLWPFGPNGKIEEK